MLLRFAVASCVAAVLLATASPALAIGTRQKILRECQDGRLTGSYTAKEIRDARNHIPTDIDQYSDCRDVLNRALAGKAAGGGGAGGGGAGGSGPGGTAPLITPSTPGDTKALQGAQQAGDQPVKVGGEAIAPGAAGLAVGAPRTPLPTILIVVLALLATSALGGATPLLRRVGGLRGLTTLPRRVLRR
jgi:hypothetical protein